MDLFAATPLQLVEDAEGGIRYWPAFLGDGEATAWFHALSEGCDWQHQRRPMYDRVVDVPRLQAWYPLDAMPPGLPLAAMLARVQAAVPGRYNSAGLNLYRDGLIFYLNRFLLGGERNERVLNYLPIQDIAELQQPGLYFAVLRREEIEKNQINCRSSRPV